MARLARKPIKKTKTDKFGRVIRPWMYKKKKPKKKKGKK